MSDGLCIAVGLLGIALCVLAGLRIWFRHKRAWLLILILPVWASTSVALVGWFDLTYMDHTGCRFTDHPVKMWVCPVK